MLTSVDRALFDAQGRCPTECRSNSCVDKSMPAVKVQRVLVALDHVQGDFRGPLSSSPLDHCHDQ